MESDFQMSKTETFKREINNLASQIIQKSREGLTVYPVNQKNLGQPNMEESDVIRGTKKRKQSCPMKSASEEVFEGQLYYKYCL